MLSMHMPILKNWSTNAICLVAIKASLPNIAWKDMLMPSISRSKITYVNTAKGGFPRKYIWKITLTYTPLMLPINAELMAAKLNSSNRPACTSIKSISMEYRSLRTLICSSLPRPTVLFLKQNKTNGKRIAPQKIPRTQSLKSYSQVTSPWRSMKA